MSQMTPYFAYGSNMDTRQFRERCPDSALVCRGVVTGYRVVLNAEGVATIIPSEGSTTYGVLCLLTPRGEEALDHYEGVAERIYTKERVSVGLESGYAVDCLTYMATDHSEGNPPRVGYLEKLLFGAESFSFPDEYILYLRGLGR